MYYKVALKKHNWKENDSWEERENILVKADHLEGVMEKLSGEYPEYKVESLQESVYTDVI